MKFGQLLSVVLIAGLVGIATNVGYEYLTTEKPHPDQKKFNEFLDMETFKNFKAKNVNALALYEWNELRKLMWSENCIISPNGFVRQIQRVAKIKDKDIFTGFAQNDLTEFLGFVIDCFNNSIKSILKKRRSSLFMTALLKF